MNNQKHLDWVDNLRGFTCLLVVIGHLLQSLTKASIDPFPNISEKIISIIYLFHMPIFFCISGILYFNKKITIKNYKNFIKKKIINLIIPYIFFYNIFMILTTMFSSNINTIKGISDWLGIFNKPISPYWFLYSLISLFIFLPLFDNLIKNDKIKLGIIILMKFISGIYNFKIYFIQSIFKYSIYFYLGKYIKININKKENILKYIIMLIIYITTSYLYSSYSNYLNKILICTLNTIFAAIGIFIFISIFKNTENNKYYFINTFKKYTFEIFLTHTIFAAFIRIVLIKFNINNYLIHIVLGLLFSIYIPIIMSKISKKIKYTEFVFYPINTIKKMKEGK